MDTRYRLTIDVDRLGHTLGASLTVFVAGEQVYCHVVPIAGPFDRPSDLLRTMGRVAAAWDAEHGSQLRLFLSPEPGPDWEPFPNPWEPGERDEEP
jgi:hypothetical protein